MLLLMICHAATLRNRASRTGCRLIVNAAGQQLSDDIILLMLCVQKVIALPFAKV
jgi:hypothetical protein